MTREEAIAILIREINEDPFMRTEHREQIHEALNMATKALEELPKRRKEAKRWKAKAAQIASKQNGWIPVSERLPKYDKEVLCFLSSDEYAVCYLTNDWGNDEFVDGGFGTGAYDVVAWMPLPKPFEPQ